MRKTQILESIVGRKGLFGERVYLGLSSTAPNPNGTNITEPSGGGYGRVLVGLSTVSLTHKFGDVANDEISNAVEIYFPESTGSWGPALTHFVFFNSDTSKEASSVIAYGELTDDGVATPVTVSAEKTVVMFRPGKLVVKFIE
jgi:hypothetical protein